MHNQQVKHPPALMVIAMDTNLMTPPHYLGRRKEKNEPSLLKRSQRWRQSVAARRRMSSLSEQRRINFSANKNKRSSFIPSSTFNPLDLHSTVNVWKKKWPLEPIQPYDAQRQPQTWQTNLFSGLQPVMDGLYTGVPRIAASAPSPEALNPCRHCPRRRTRRRGGPSAEVFTQTRICQQTDQAAGGSDESRRTDLISHKRL